MSDEINEPKNPSKRRRKSWPRTIRDDLDMSNGCLVMIYDWIVAIKGEEWMKGCPPMFYPEALHNVRADAIRETYKECAEIAANQQSGALAGELILARLAERMKPRPSLARKFDVDLRKKLEEARQQGNRA